MRDGARPSIRSVKRPPSFARLLKAADAFDLCQCDDSTRAVAPGLVPIFAQDVWSEAPVQFPLDCDGIEVVGPTPTGERRFVLGTMLDDRFAPTLAVVKGGRIRRLLRARSTPRVDAWMRTALALQEERRALFPRDVVVRPDPGCVALQRALQQPHRRHRPINPERYAALQGLFG